jgi:DNA-binding MarR family transcriptional regulator
MLPLLHQQLRQVKRSEVEDVPILPQPILLLVRQATGYGMTEIANRLGLTQPAVSIAARRGEEIATQNGYPLFD